MNPQPQLRKILIEHRERLHKILGGDLDSVVLYDSQARGDATEASDVDVLCIMKKTFDYGDMILRTGESNRVIWIPASAGMTNSRKAAGNEPPVDSSR